MLAEYIMYVMADALQAGWLSFQYWTKKIYNTTFDF